MSGESTDQVELLLEEAARLPDGPAKLMILEEAARLADSFQNTRLGFETRQALIHAATFGGRPEVALVAFTWCLAQCDRAPDEFNEQELLWQYKWIIHSMTHFPQISRPQIDAMLDDMTVRYRRCGSGLRGVVRQRFNLAIDAGEIEEARRLLRDLETMPRDRFSDCQACERAGEVELFIDLNQDEQAVQWAQPLVQRRLRCAETLQHIHAHLLLPLFRLGRLHEAMQHHQRGFRLIVGNAKFLRDIADHLRFLVLTDNLNKGLKVFEQHLPMALDTMSLDRRFEFYLGGLLLLHRMEETGKKTIRLRELRDFPPVEDKGRYPLADVLGWLEGNLADIGRRFDERNGNGHYLGRIEEHREMLRKVTPWPLRGNPAD